MKRYAYVGPEHVRAAAANAEPGTAIATRDDLARWLSAHRDDREGDVIPATFVVTPDGMLRLAARRSEHVACAGGQAVLSAGELFVSGHRVTAISNLSTGFCPEPESWPAVAAALDRASIAHPGRFTTEVIFRRCTACGERNVVKDDFYVCAICNADLPAEWNFTAGS